MMGSGLMGFGKPEDDAPGPNRAQRRAHQQMLKRQQRRGQRAYERSLRAGEPAQVARARGDVAAFTEGDS